jgi:hypothetical protein
MIATTSARRCVVAVREVQPAGSVTIRPALSARRYDGLMLANWLRRKIHRAGIKGDREDLESFIESLRGQTAEELSALVALAAVMRMVMRDCGVLPDHMLQITTAPEQALTQLAVSRLVQRYQAEKRFTEASGAIVWLHTLRALSAPELRLLGRQMWQQLERGQLNAPQAVEDLQAMTGKPAQPGTLAACAFIPDDLDPSDLEFLRRTPSDAR